MVTPNKILLWITGRKICPQCGGSGKYFSEGMARDYLCNDPLICDTCKGKGLIKKDMKFPIMLRKTHVKNLILKENEIKKLRDILTNERISLKEKYQKEINELRKEIDKALPKFIRAESVTRN